MKRSPIALLVLLALSLPLVQSACSADDTINIITNSGKDCPTSIQASMTTLINEARAQARTCGNINYSATLPVTWNTLLAIAAIGHSQDMASHDFSSHIGSDGLDALTRVEAAGYEPAALGENIGAGQTQISEIINGWLGSEGHGRNIMSPLFTEIGAGCASNDASYYGTYWTLELARPR